MTNSLCVLIVEDNSTTALEIKRFLLRLGHTVVGIARRDTQAVDLFKEHLPDVVLMDIELIEGSKDGIEVSKLLTKIQPTPTIFLTSHQNDASIQRRAIATKPANFLFKSIDLNEEKLAIAIDLAVSSFGDFVSKQGSHKHSSHDNSDVLFIKNKGSLQKIPLKTITHLLALGGTTLIRTTSEKSVPHSSSLSSFLRIVDNDLLYQIHKEHAVNLKAVQTVDIAENLCTLVFKHDPSEKIRTISLKIGRDFKKGLIQRLNYIKTKEK